MTEREMKQAVALRLMQKAGDLIEFWEESTEGTSAEGIPGNFARDCIARWLRTLPGNDWDLRLDASDLP